VRDCGLDPMAAMASANSLGAEALGLGDQIGSIAPGFQADIIALDGDQLKDITAVLYTDLMASPGPIAGAAAKRLGCNLPALLGGGWCALLYQLLSFQLSPEFSRNLGLH